MHPTYENHSGTGGWDNSFKSVFMKKRKNVVCPQFSPNFLNFLRPPHQPILTLIGKSVIALSILANGRFSSLDWAANIRSKGSRWEISQAPDS
jgi:hypothetical protein